MLRCLIASVTVMAFTPVATAEPVKLNPGNWSMVVEVMLDGGAEALNRQELSQCMTARDASMEPTDLAKAFAGGPGCTASDVAQNGNKVTFTMVCPNPPISTGYYTLIHNFDDFTMTADQAMEVNGSTVDLDVKITAARSGAC